MSRGLSAEVSRYGQVGLAVYLADLALFWAVLSDWPDAHLTASAAGRVGGAALGFLLHRVYTFHSARTGDADRQALRYALLFGANLAASSALLWLAADLLGAPALPARVAVDILVIAASFVANRAWVYRTA